MADPEAVTSYEELHSAVLDLMGRDSKLDAVALRTGLGRTTVHALRNDNRRLRPASLTKIVNAYDPGRTESWLAALARTSTPTTPAAPTAQARPAVAASAVAASAVATSAAVTAATPEPRPPAAGAAAGRPRDRAHRRRSVSPLVTLVLVVSAGLGGWLVGREQASPAVTTAVIDQPLPVTPSALPPAGCPQPALQTPAAVVAEPGARVTGVGVSSMSYTYTRAYSPQIELGGGLSGPVPPGWQLFVLSWDDPASTDSTSGHNPGNGRYYPTRRLDTTADRCFLVPRTEMGYGGFTGMRVRQYVALVPDDEAVSFERDGNAQDGYTTNDLARRGVELLAYFTLQTF